jgi:TonB-linked SusC/RagA family outer membrane protein
MPKRKRPTLYMNDFKNILTAMLPIGNLVKTGLLWLVVMIAGTTSFAQGQTIEVVKGVVKSENGEILVGASVSVPGTAISVNSRKDGSFELHQVPEGANIRVSYVGLNNAVVKLKPGQTTINFILADPNNMMDQVTVNVGLYKRPNGNFTGAAKTITGDELKTVNPTNVLKALAALDPSVRIAENNVSGSDPNKLPIIQIRGQNNLPVSLQGGTANNPTPVTNGDIMSSYLQNPNEPLIILDGFQTTLQTIYDMDINRIASITILKDAAATTAYGSKAANGVLVVETKIPLQGKTQVTYAVNFNIDLADLTSYHLLDANGLLEAQRLAGVYTDANNHYNDVALKQWYDYRLQQVRSGVNTYWLSKPLRTGFGTNHSVSLSGGSRYVRYAFSMNYNNGVGIMKGSGRDRFSLNNVINYSREKIRISNNTSVTYSKGKNSAWGAYNQYANQFPFFKPTDSAGNVVKFFEPAAAELGIGVAAPGNTGAGIANAAYNARLAVKDYSLFYGLTNNTSFEWTITNGLRMKAALNIAMNLPGSEQFYPADHTSFANEAFFTNMGSYTQVRGRNNVADGRWGLDFNKKIGNHSFLASAGFQAQATSSHSTTIIATGIPTENLAQLGFANGYGDNTKPATTRSVTHTVSSYVSVSYNYLSRYTVELTGNASGSSQFGANNRVAPFWAGGVSWNIDREPFFPRNSIIQSLKVRTTTGITGNQNFAAYLGQPMLQYNMQNNYRLQLGANLMSYANPDLKWQQTLKNNLGITASLFKGKFNVGVEFYREKTDNLILPLDVAPSTGFASYQNNLGSTRNTGYEISVAAPIINDRTKKISWSFSANGGHYKNVITRLSPAIELLNKANNNTTDLKLQLTPLPRYVVGQSLSRIWAVPSLGIDPATGREVFVKLDGSQTFIWDPTDKRPVGETNPVIKGMVGSNFNYRGFIFNINLSYQYGSQLYNQTLVDKIENVDLRTTNADERVLTERWKQPGDKASFKALVANGTNGLQLTNSTSRFVQDDNYLQASSLTIGYAFPTDLLWVKKMHLSTPRLMITQNDAFRLATIKTERGTGYPFTRSYSFGLSTSF